MYHTHKQLFQLYNNIIQFYQVYVCDTIAESITTYRKPSIWKVLLYLCRCMWQYNYNMIGNLSVWRISAKFKALVLYRLKACK